VRIDPDAPPPADRPPAPEEFFDPSEFPLRLPLEERHYWHRHRRRVILDAVSGLVEPGAALIDLGCGVGTVALHLNRHGIHTDCADVHGEALALARRRFAAAPGLGGRPVRFFRHDLTRDEPPEGARAGYAGALLLDVLEHLPDDEAALRRALGFLAPGAESFLAVSVPAFALLWSPWDVLERHRRRYSRAALAGALARAGFEPERLTYFFLPLFVPAALVKGLRALRDRVVGRRPPRRITDLVETKGPRLLGALLAPALALERRRLARGDLPFGTSLLCIARRAG